MVPVDLIIQDRAYRGRRWWSHLEEYSILCHPVMVKLLKESYSLLTNLTQPLVYLGLHRAHFIGCYENHLWIGERGQVVQMGIQDFLITLLNVSLNLLIFRSGICPVYL